MSRLQHQLLGIAKVIVSGCNYPVARLEAVGNFVLLRVLSADGERHAHGTRLVLVQLVDPLPTRSLVEIVKTRSTSNMRSFTSGTTLVIFSG